MQKFRVLVLVLVLILSMGATWAGDWFPISSPEAPTARQGHSMVTLPDGRVLLFGGEGDQGLFKDLYAFENNGWAKITPKNSAPPARSDHQAWVRGDAMYIYGGRGNNAILDDLWSYDSVANTWQQVQISGKRPVARHGHSATKMLDGSVLIVAGTDANGNPLKDCWKLNTNNTFTQLTDAPYAFNEHRAELVVNGDWLLVFGKPGSIGIYRVSTNDWSLVSGGPPNGEGCTTSRGVNAAGDPVIFIFGGKDANGREMSTVYEYDVYNGQLTQRESMPQPVVNGAAASLSNQQSAMLPSGIINCIPVATTQTLDLQMVFFGGLTNGVPTNTGLWFSSQGTPPPPPPPPPVTGEVTCDTSTLGQGRFSMYVVKFPQSQKKVEVKLTWEESKAKLYLLTLGLPSAGREFTGANAALRYTLRRLRYFHILRPKRKKKNRKKWYRKYRKHSNVEYETSIEKSFENVQFLLLLVKHAGFSKTAKNIHLEIDEMSDNPSTVSYLFPIGTFKHKQSPRSHSWKFPVEPVRWFSKYPPKSKVEEKTESGASFWKWTCIDSSPHRCFYFFRMAFVKFILP